MESHKKHTTLFKTHTCPIRILPLLVALAAFLHAGAENAEDKDAPNTVDTINIYSLKEVEVSASMRNRFASPTSHTVAKMQLGDLENPQVYQTVSSALLKEQLVTNLNDALKNVPGVQRLWESTGRQSDGGEYYTMRGFSVQPTIINGVAGLSNGALDPANVAKIEAIKGPSGTLYGGNLISYGGLINIVTKTPYNSFGGSVGYMTGSHGLNRFTADVNTPLSSKAHLRVNAAYHYQRSFQDAGFSRSLFIAPSFRFDASDRLTFLVNAEYYAPERAVAPMIFLYRSSDVQFKDTRLFDAAYKRSFTSDELTISNPTFGLQAQALYNINSHWSSQTIVSSSIAGSDGYYTYLWNNQSSQLFTRYASKVNSTSSAINIQQNFNADHRFGTVRNRFLAGADFLQRNIVNNANPWVANGEVSLADGSDTGVLTASAIDKLVAEGKATQSRAKVTIYGVYVSDVIDITRHLSALVGLRLDNYSGGSMYATEEVKDQLSFSQKLGLVFQPLPDRLSLFANYMNGFTNNDPVSVYDKDGKFVKTKVLDPEHANQWEAGVKANLWDERLTLTASYYDIRVGNRSMTDPDNPLNTVQGGVERSKGVELSLTANPLTGLNVIMGYSYNDNKITKDAADGDYLGRRSESAGPAHMFNLWASYRFFTGALKGWSVGLGGNAASENKILNRRSTGTFALPGYVVVNGLLSYTGDRYTISLKADNLLNKKYYNGWSTVSPQRLFNVSIGAEYRF